MQPAPGSLSEPHPGQIVGVDMATCHRLGHCCGRPVPVAANIGARQFCARGQRGGNTPGPSARRSRVLDNTGESAKIVAPRRGGLE